MPAVTRELEIDYGGFKVGGSTDYLLHEYTQQRQSFDVARVAFKVEVVASGESGFQTACNDLEEAFRKPFQSLSITQGGATLLELGPDFDFGFEAQPSAEKQGTPDADTGRSRLYLCEILFGLPADNVSPDFPDGMRSSQTTIAYSASRRRDVSISGVWTTVGGTTATAKYEAEFDAYAQSVLSALGGTFERIDEARVVDQHDDVLEFGNTYREILFGQGKGVVDDPDIVDQSLTIVLMDQYPGDTPIQGEGGGGGGGAPDETQTVSPGETRAQGAILRVKMAVANYDCAIDAEKTTKLEEKWAALKPWVVEQAEAVLDGGSVALMDSRVQYDRDNNRISATLTLQGTQGGNVLENRVDATDSVDMGFRYAPVMSGDPNEKYEFGGPSSVRRTIIRTAVILGAVKPWEIRQTQGKDGLLPNRPPDTSPIGQPRDSTIVHRSTEATELLRGDPNTGQQFLVTEIQITTIIEFFNRVGGSRTGPVTPRPGDSGPSGSPTPEPEITRR